MKYIGALAIIIAASLWGADGVILRPFLYGLDVGVVVFLEHAIAFVLMAYFLYRERKELARLDKKDWMSFFWIALFGGAIGTMAIVKSIFLTGHNPISVVLIIQKLQPLFAIVLAMIILKERPVKWFYPLALLALAGSYLITFGFQSPDLTGNIFQASMYSFIAAFSFGSSTVFGRRVLKKVNFRVSTYVRFGLTSIIVLLIIVISGNMNRISEVAQKQLGVILLIIFTTGAATLFLYYYGLQKVRASKATIFELAFPVSAIVLEYFIRGQTLNLGQWFGACLLVSSMTILVVLRNK